MVFRISYEQIIKDIGHDGTERVRDADPPKCYRGFHPQEVIEVGLDRGYPLMQIELYPSLHVGNVDVFYKLPNVRNEIHEHRLIRHMTQTSLGDVRPAGILATVNNLGVGHALAFEGLGNETILVNPSSLGMYKVRTVNDIRSLGYEPILLYRVT